MKASVWTALVTATVLVLSGCGPGETADSAPAIGGAGSAPTKAFDVVVMGSEQGNILQSDLYGLTLNPLRVYRITTDKRISSVSATTQQIVVAAADEQIDQLGRVLPDGLIEPIPGLGRPPASDPELLQNGAIRFFDAEGEGDLPDRYLEWDPTTSKQRVLHRTASPNFIGFAAGPSGRFLNLYDDESGRRFVKILGDQKAVTYPLPAASGLAVWGAKLIAIDLRKESGQGFPTPVGTLLLDPDAGKRITVDGWSAIGWASGGERLLVQRTGGAPGASSELGVLAAADPQNVRSVGTIPYLEIYGGSWVRGEPAVG